MKKFLLCALLLLGVSAFAQVAVNLGTLYECDGPDQDGHAIFNMYSDAQLPILEAQDDPNGYEITFHLTQENALNWDNVIPNYDYYENISNPQAIYYRLTKISNQAFVVGSFQLVVASQPGFQDVSVCGSYILPEVLYGSYYTAPNGGGAQVAAGSVLTTSQTIYLYSELCPEVNTSFTVTIYNPEPYMPPTHVVACGSYTLPEPPFAGDQYVLNNQFLPAGTEITSSQYLAYVHYYGPDLACQEFTYFNVVIFTAPSPVNAYGCDTDGDGVAEFDLNAALALVQPYSNVTTTFYTSQADAEAFTNPITSLPFANTNGLEYVYAAYTLNGVVCGGTTPMFLLTAVLTPGTPPEVYTGCDPDGDGLGAFNMDDLTVQLLNGSTYTTVEYYLSEADALTGTNAMSGFGYLYNTIPNEQTIYATLRTYFSPCSALIPVNLQTAGNCTLGSLSGTVRYDSTNNGCTASDATVANTAVTYSNGNTNITTYTDANGHYSFSQLPLGNGSVLAIDNTYGNYTTADFELTETTNALVTNLCLPAEVLYTDAAIAIVPAQTPQPGFIASYAIFVQNNGAQPVSGTASVTFDTTKMSFVSGAGITASGNTLTFTYNLTAYQNVGHTAIFQIVPPPAANSGDVVTFVATVGTVENDWAEYNNTATLTQTIVNSYDPNEIVAHRGPAITQEQANGYYDYTIHFQNMGTASATTVKITTVLDSEFDAASFTPVGASHPYTVTRMGNMLTFVFDDINLAAAAQNEAASHGWVSFRVLSSTIDVGTEFTETASIYFDFNEAIVTNTAVTVIEEELSVSAPEKTGSFTLYPNPASGTVLLQLQNGLAADVLVTDLSGKTVLRHNQLQSGTPLDISALSPGMYMATVIGEGHTETKKLIVK